MLVFMAASSFVFPYIGLYMHNTLAISLALVGVVMGISNFAGMPFQVLGGFWADHRGRRGVMLFSLLASVILFTALIFVHSVWLVVTLVIAQGALGWPMFLTASNAMVADLVPPERTVEAYGLIRVAMNAGTIIGPAVAGLALAGGATFGQLFLTAAAGCAVLLVLLRIRLRESRPDSLAERAAAAGGETAANGQAVATGPGADTPEASPSPAPADRAGTLQADETAIGAAVDPFTAEKQAGYREVLRDRRFLAVCTVSLLPLFAYGNVVTTLPVYLNAYLGVSAATFGLLISFNGFVIITMQYPLVRRLRHADHLLLAALSSALLGLGIGAYPLATGTWALVVVMFLFTIGEMIFVPISSAIIADLAPEHVRGRYMGVWSLIWIGGQAIAPTTMGLAMNAMGRASFLIVIAVGAAGALLFIALRRMAPADATEQTAAAETT